MNPRFSKDFWPLRAHPPRHDVPSPMQGNSLRDDFLASSEMGEENLASDEKNVENIQHSETEEKFPQDALRLEEETGESAETELDPELPRLFSIEEIERCAPPEQNKSEQATDSKFMLENRNTVPRTVEPVESFLPNLVFLPESYEPNYAYPLIVWLHEEGGSEQDLARVMPQISTRNYIGVSFRAPHILPGVKHGRASFGWSQDDAAIREFAQKLKEAVLRLRSACHIHSERIFLAGQGHGATMALRLQLEYPEWFGGAALFGGDMPDMPSPLARFPALAGKRLLISGVHGSEFDQKEMIRRGRLFHAAGMQISTRPFRGGAELSPQMLSILNQWVMEGICQPART